MVPNMGNISGMTLREYIKAGRGDINSMAATLGVSTFAVRKWVYGQRSPTLEMAFRIVSLTGGAVDLETLIKKPEAV